MGKIKRTNLFVYGSLRDTKVFKSVSGLTFTRKLSRAKDGVIYAEPALLDGYRKISPDNVYFYAVEHKLSRIHGLVIYNVPDWAMAEIDKYEGKRYESQEVHVNSGSGLVKAVAYLGCQESLKKDFGDRFHVNLIHELWLRKRIQKYFNRHTRPGDRTQDAKLERRAERELRATTERDLVISHYHSDAVSDYFLKRELDRPRRSIRQLFDDELARRYSYNYLFMVIKQTLLNQLEDKILSLYRFELDHLRSSERYFKRSVSLLIALQMINSNYSAVSTVITRLLETMPFGKHDLIDYVKAAAHASDSFFDRRVAGAYLQRISWNFNPGLIPLGAEVELSNLGADAVEPFMAVSDKEDIAYDGFRYFSDFGLDILSWKLGGYIDDHSGSSGMERRSGFLEFAPGRLNVSGELSRPATADPWLLNQLIHELVLFYDVNPHSLHLSFQLTKKQMGSQNVLPLSFVKCLLVLGGGLEESSSGRLWVSRLVQKEITTTEKQEELVFCRTSKRNWYMGLDTVGDIVPKQAMTHIQQYKFIRLEKRANYEPIIMCLKGLQMALNPCDYLTGRQLEESKKLRDDYEQLKIWAADPTPIDGRVINRFVETVYDGLMNERHNKPAHKLYYIDWAVGAVDVQLRLFNEKIKQLDK